MPLMVYRGELREFFAARGLLQAFPFDVSPWQVVNACLESFRRSPDLEASGVFPNEDGDDILSYLHFTNSWISEN